MNKRIFYSEYFYQKGSKDTGVLERNANEYPYSSLASFLLLYHYKKTANPAFEKFAKKTALLFNNPHWLQFQLFDTSATDTEKEIIIDENFQEENKTTINDNNEIYLKNSFAENVIEEPATGFEQKIINEENVEQENVITIDSNEITSANPSTENATKEVPGFEQEIIGEENFQQDNAVTTLNNNEIPLETSSIENIMEESGMINEQSALNIAGIEEIKEVSDEPIVEPPVEETLQHEIEKQENSEEPVLNNSSQAKEIIESKNTLNETPITESAVTEIAQGEKAKTENENAANENDPITFEPLHTVDYFASQGIKITEELLTNDKLGRQMKSFTAWLKSMKKLHPGKLEEQSLAAEKLIQASADESNFNAEILTEAMAEVLIKQDKKDKAIEMFSKLSLINPAKSAYFAARIESIKSN